MATSPVISMFHFDKTHLQIITKKNVLTTLMAALKPSKFVLTSKFTVEAECPDFKFGIKMP